MDSNVRRSAVLAFAAAVGVSSVFAQHLSPQSIPLPDRITVTRSSALFGAVRAGTLNIALEKTSLFDVQRAFGGTVQHEGDAGDATEWLCYAGTNAQGAPVIFWFLSGEMGGAEESILSLAEQPVVDGKRSDKKSLDGKSPNGERTDGCDAAPRDLHTIDFGIPAVGVSVGDVVKRFGASTPDAAGNFHYAASFPSSVQKDFTVTQTVVYTAAHGTITGTAITQVTSD